MELSKNITLVKLFAGDYFVRCFGKSFFVPRCNVIIYSIMLISMILLLLQFHTFAFFITIIGMICILLSSEMLDEVTEIEQLHTDEQRWIFAKFNDIEIGNDIKQKFSEIETTKFYNTYLLIGVPYVAIAIASIVCMCYIIYRFIV